MYDYKITIKKFALLFLEVLVLGAIAYMTENNLYFFLLPALEALKNYLKHRNK